MGEFELISRYFSNSGARRQDAAIGVGDDGAVLQIRDGYDLVVTTDTMVAGTHFFLMMIPELWVISWLPSTSVIWRLWALNPPGYRWR